MIVAGGYGVRQGPCTSFVSVPWHRDLLSSFRAVIWTNLMGMEGARILVARPPPFRLTQETAGRVARQLGVLWHRRYEYGETRELLEQGLASHLTYGVSSW